MSRWQEDRDVGTYPTKPAPPTQPPGAPHAALCPAMVGEGCQCEARVLKRVIGRKLVEETVRVMKATPTVTATDLALAKALGKVHELEWALSEAKTENQRLSEKLAFTERALDLHTKHCERQLPPPLPTKRCLCFPNQPPNVICPLHGAIRS